MDPPTQMHRFSIKHWPPSQSTRLMLVDRMIKKLITPYILSRKYGLFTKEEAEEDAKQIEILAFSAANQHFEKEPDGDGSSAVQLYAKESSKLMLEVVRRGLRTKNQDDEDEDGVEISKNVHETVFDISGGRRASTELVKEAEELFKPLIKHGYTYSKILCSTESFCFDAAHVVEPILANLKSQLTHFDFSDFTAGRPEEEALKVMSKFSFVLEGSESQHLSLSNNALGEKGVRAFGSLLSLKNNLEELYLKNEGISEEVAHAVRKLIPSTKKLKILHIDNDMTGDEGAIAMSEMLKNSPVLEDFRCSSTRVDPEGGVALSDAIGTCNEIKKLDIRDSVFGVEAGVALSKALLGLPNLTEIYLSYLNLENEGSIALANALKESAPHLEVLEMSGCEINDGAASALAECIVSKKNLAKLILSANELEDEGTIVIAKALEEGHSPLVEVDLSINLITRAGAMALAQVVLGKTGFKLLNINYTFISNEGIDEIKGLFKDVPDVLGPLDDNDPGDDNNDDDDLEFKLNSLEIKQED